MEKKTVERLSFKMTWENMGIEAHGTGLSLIVNVMRPNVEKMDWDTNPVLFAYLWNRIPNDHKKAISLLGYGYYPTAIRLVSQKHMPIMTPAHLQGQPFFVNCYVRYLDSDEQQYVTIGVNYKVHDEDDDETFGNIREDDVYEGYDASDWVIVSVIGFSPLSIDGGPNFRYTVEVE